MCLSSPTPSAHTHVCVTGSPQRQRRPTSIRTKPNTHVWTPTSASPCVSSTTHPCQVTLLWSRHGQGDEASMSVWKPRARGRHCALLTTTSAPSVRLVASFTAQTTPCEMQACAPGLVQHVTAISVATPTFTPPPPPPPPTTTPTP